MPDKSMVKYETIIKRMVKAGKEKYSASKLYLALATIFTYPYEYLKDTIDSILMQDYSSI